MEKIRGIQHARGIAALGVVVDHASQLSSLDKYFATPIWDGFLSTGGRGVDLFFLISGFVICVASLSEDGLKPRLSPAEFLKRRFARLIPLMWLAVLSYAALRLLGRGVFPGDDYLRALLLLPWSTVQPPQIWTLRHELVFYVIFALSFLGRPGLRVILCAWVAATLAWMARPPGYPILPGIGIVLNAVNVEFCSGLLFGLAWLKWGRTFRLRMPLSVPLSIALYFVGAMVVFFEFPQSGGFVPFRIWASAVFLPLLAIAVYARSRETWLDRVMGLLGDASYSVYLFHTHFLSALLWGWSKTAPTTPLPMVIAVTTLVTVLGGILIHIHVERPLVAATRRAMGLERGIALPV